MKEQRKMGASMLTVGLSQYCAVELLDLDVCEVEAGPEVVDGARIGLGPSKQLGGVAHEPCLERFLLLG
jgi:hypothetical protein